MANRFNVSDKISTPVVEAYKVLRTNIQFQSFNKKVKTLAITSCNPGEGKTTTSVNLALSMAKAGMKVLLIDADLRKDTLMKSLSSTNEVGLSNLIEGYNTLEEVTAQGGADNFFYIACGLKPQNPAEMLGSSGFKDFLNKVESLYDMVIIDTPPLGAVIDCAVISAQVDGTLIVIKAGEVEIQQALQVKEQLEKIGVNILGIILNKIDKKLYKNVHKYYNYYEEKIGSKKSRKAGRYIYD